MEAVIYARYSPRRNAADCESIETQVGLCWSHAEGLGARAIALEREVAGA